MVGPRAVVARTRERIAGARSNGAAAARELDARRRRSDLRGRKFTAGEVARSRSLDAQHAQLRQRQWRRSLDPRGPPCDRTRGWRVRAHGREQGSDDDRCDERRVHRVDTGELRLRLLAAATIVRALIARAVVVTPAARTAVATSGGPVVFTCRDLVLPLIGRPRHRVRRRVLTAAEVIEAAAAQHRPQDEQQGYRRARCHLLPGAAEDHDRLVCTIR